MRIFLILLGLLLAQQASAEEQKETKTFSGVPKALDLCQPKCKELGKREASIGKFLGTIFEINCDSESEECTCVCNMRHDAGKVNVSVKDVCENTCKAVPGDWIWSGDYSIVNEDYQLAPKCTCERYIDNDQKSTSKG